MWLKVEKQKFVREHRVIEDVSAVHERVPSNSSDVTAQRFISVGESRFMRGLKVCESIYDHA
jgi:hypothetical protein